MVVEEAWKELLQLWSISWQMKVQQFEVTYLWGIPLKKTASLLWNHFQFWFWLYPREQHCKLTSFFTCPLSVHLSACWSMTFHIGEPPHTKDDMDDIPAALQFPWGALRSLPRWSGILEDRVPLRRDFNEHVVQQVEYGLNVVTMLFWCNMSWPPWLCMSIGIFACLELYTFIDMYSHVHVQVAVSCTPTARIDSTIECSFPSLLRSCS